MIYYKIIPDKRLIIEYFDGLVFSVLIMMITPKLLMD